MYSGRFSIHTTTLCLVYIKRYRFHAEHAAYNVNHGAGHSLATILARIVSRKYIDYLRLIIQNEMEKDIGLPFRVADVPPTIPTTTVRQVLLVAQC